VCGGGLPYELDAIYLGSPLLRAALGPAMLAALLWPAYLNFRRIELHLAWLSNLVMWVATVIVLMAATSGVYARLWELVLPLEPRHGPARLGLSPNLRLCSTFTGVFVVLPDGRLWECPIVTPDSGQFATSLSSAGPAFVPGSNWAKIAGNHRGLLATRSDGTLWFIPANRQIRPLTVTQLGSDADWKSVAAGFGEALALKQDGSLWELHRGKTNSMSRLGEESGWEDIFGTDSGVVAVKADGTVWHWQFMFEPAGEGKKARLERWVKAWQLPFSGTNWASFAILYPGPVGLDEKGNIWTSTPEWNYLTSGTPLPQNTPMNATAAAHPGWRAVAGNWVGWARVDSAGRLWTQQARFNYGDWATLNPWAGRTPHQLSKYSDWLAATTLNESTIALADDGTVSSWHLPDSWEEQTSLLAPSRKPEWSLNLFEPSRQ
jgi:hypothetical protein